MLSFSNYLKEEDIEPGQAEEAHQPTGEASSAVENPVIVSEINTLLLKELADGPIVNVQAGVQKVRKILHRFGLDMPALYDADPEGDEITFDLNQFDNPDNVIYLYLLYYLADEGYYDFFAQVGDAETIDNLASEIDEED